MTVVLRLHDDDRRLERALETLDAPEHAPAFYAELREQLRWESFVVGDIVSRERRPSRWRLIPRRRRDI